MDYQMGGSCGLPAGASVDFLLGVWVCLGTQAGPCSSKALHHCHPLRPALPVSLRCAQALLSQMQGARARAGPLNGLQCGLLHEAPQILPRGDQSSHS